MFVPFESFQFCHIFYCSLDNVTQILLFPVSIDTLSWSVSPFGVFLALYYISHVYLSMLLQLSFSFMHKYIKLEHLNLWSLFSFVIFFIDCASKCYLNFPLSVCKDTLRQSVCSFSALSYHSRVYLSTVR